MHAGQSSRKPSSVLCYAWGVSARVEFCPRLAFITGASGAIGRALTRKLSQAWPALRFSLVDREPAGLSALCAELGERAQAQVADLAAPAVCPELFAEATRAAGPVDLLVNCAGFMDVRAFAETPWELGEQLLNVDLISPLRLMQLAVAQLPVTGGAIVNISSMAGRVPLRGCAYYGAAKAGLLQASQIAGLELSERRVHVLSVLPGPVRSPLEAAARAQLPSTFLTRSLPTGDPLELARRIVWALQRGKRRLVYPSFYRLADDAPGVAERFTRAFSPPAKRQLASVLPPSAQAATAPSETTDS